MTITRKAHPSTRIPGLPEDVRSTVARWSRSVQPSPLYLALERDGRITAQPMPRGTLAHLVGTPPARHLYVQPYAHLSGQAREQAATVLEAELQGLAEESLAGGETATTSYNRYVREALLDVGEDA